MPNPVADFPWEKINIPAEGIAHTGPCVLHSIIFNGMTVVGDCAIYDGVDNAGTLIGTLILRSAVQVSCQPFTAIYDCEMATGIFLSFNNGLVGDFTVTFK